MLEGSRRTEQLAADVASPRRSRRRIRWSAGCRPDGVRPPPPGSQPECTARLRPMGSGDGPSGRGPPTGSGVRPPAGRWPPGPAAAGPAAPASGTGCGPRQAGHAQTPRQPACARPGRARQPRSWSPGAPAGPPPAPPAGPATAPAPAWPARAAAARPPPGCPSAASGTPCAGSSARCELAARGGQHMEDAGGGALTASRAPRGCGRPSPAPSSPGSAAGPRSPRPMCGHRPAAGCSHPPLPARRPPAAARAAPPAAGRASSLTPRPLAIPVGWRVHFRTRVFVIRTNFGLLVAL